MPRHTPKVAEVREQLLVRLRQGPYRPGDRFMSNRAVARQFGVSYQTAHRLLEALCDEGHLERRAQAGTYVPGGVRERVGVQLVFHPRADRAGSFGEKLRTQLAARFDAERIPCRFDASSADVTLRQDHLPVLWEAPEVLARCVAEERSAVLIHDRPPLGMGSLFVDSVSTDDFGGGVCAAQLLKARRRTRTGFAVLAGPGRDPRSQLRVAGFRSALPARVITAGGWYYEDGTRAAARAVRAAKAGLFCANDRLAEAVLAWCREHDVVPPPIVGFDDAPVAERLDLTTIAIPWTEIVDGVVRLVKRRLSGDNSASSHQVFNPRPVVRGSAKVR